MRRIWNLLLALGVVLILQGAPAAYASEWLAEWQIEGDTMESLELTEETVEGAGKGSFGMSTVILGEEVSFTCIHPDQSGTLDQEGVASMTLEYTGCTVEQPPSCSLGSGITASTTAELIEAEGSEVLYEKLRPPTGETLMEPVFSGESCPLDEVALPIKGSICEETPGVEEEQLEEPFVSSGAIQEASKCGPLKVGKKEAEIVNEAEVPLQLAGAKAGFKWAPARASLCKVRPVNTFCPKKEAFKGTVRGNLKAGQEIHLAKIVEGKSVGEVTCSESKFEGPFRTSGMGKINTFTYTGAKGAKCTDTIPGEAAEVEATFTSLPTVTSLFLYNLAVAEFDGTLALASTPSQLSLKITFKEVCTYQLATSYGTVKNGTEKAPTTTFDAGGVWQPVSAEKGNKAECPAPLEQKNATFELKGEEGEGGPIDIYVARWW